MKHQRNIQWTAPIQLPPIIVDIKTFTRSKPQAPSSSFLPFLIVSRSSYIIIQPNSTALSPKILRLTLLTLNESIILQLYEHNF